MPPPVSSSLARLVGNHHVGLAAPPDVDADELGKIVDVDHDPLDAGPFEPVEGAVDQRTAADLDQRLRRRHRDRPHALADAGGQHHRPLRADRPGLPLEIWSGGRLGVHSAAWLGAGRCLSYQTARSERTGCLRLRAKICTDVAASAGDNWCFRRDRLAARTRRGSSAPAPSPESHTPPKKPQGQRSELIPAAARHSGRRAPFRGVAGSSPGRPDRGWRRRRRPAQ